MKKVFMVEIDYEEVEKNKAAHVVYDKSLEVAVENYLEGFIETDNLGEKYTVNVTEVTK